MSAGWGTPEVLSEPLLSEPLLSDPAAGGQLLSEDQLAAITVEVWGSLVEPESMAPVQFPDGEGEPDRWVSASVEISGAWHGAVAVSTDDAGAHRIARALLRLDPQEAVTEPDVADALGELANVVGGNVKASLPYETVLGLPRVAEQEYRPAGASQVCRFDLPWRGGLLTLTVWQLAGRTGFQGLAPEQEGAR